MTIAEENWSVMASLFPEGWQEMALQSGAFERLREFPSPGALLRTLLLHVGRGYSLRETAVRAKLAHWADVSDVALLKRLRKSEDWLRALCVELLLENGVKRDFLIWGFEQRYVAILSPVLGDGGFTADDQGTTVNDEPVAGARSPNGEVGFSVTVVVAGHRDVAS